MQTNDKIPKIKIFCWQTMTTTLRNFWYQNFVKGLINAINSIAYSTMRRLKTIKK